MADRKLKATIDVETKKAVTETKKLAQAVEDVGDEFADTESAGKRMARGLSQMADDIEAEFAQASSAAERLGQALGPEFSADAERGEQAVMELVAQLRAAGLTYDDIKADADELAMAVKKLDAAGSNVSGLRAGTDDVADGFRRVSNEADNTRSVVANFAGNATQELPGITGAMGPLNMAIGQFAEYASEGNIRLKNFVGAGAGLALVAVAASGISRYFERVAATKAFERARIDAYNDALGETETTAKAIAKVFTDTGKMEFDIGFGTQDFTSIFADLGLNVSQVSSLIAGGEEAINSWSTAMAASSMDADKLKFATQLLKEEVTRLAEAQESGATQAEFFGQKLDANEQSYVAFAEGAKSAYDNVIDFDASLEDAGDEAESTQRKIEALQEGVERLQGALGKREAFESAVQGWDRVLWASTAAQNAEAAGAENAAELRAEANDAIRESIDATLAYIATVGGIPANQTTEIEALIDQGKYNEVETLLQQLARRRTATIEALGTYLGRERRAAGGPVAAGHTYLVGERGPELVTMGGNGHVTPNHALGGVGGSSAGATINVTVNAGMGTNGQQVADQIVDVLRRWTRTNGPLPVTTR